MKGQILVLDDNLIDVKIVTNVIERTGYACFGFTEYQKALVWLGSNQPQMIFLDLQMPKITGYEMIPLIKILPGMGKVPIIIISGNNQTEDIMKAIKLGAVDYIVKPIDPLVIQEKLEKVSLQTPSEFHSVYIGNEKGVEAYLSRSIKILAASEFGIKVHSDVKLNSGETIEITGAPMEIFGKSSILVRCLSCEHLPEQKSYLLQMTFVGMTEAQRQVIRKNCRQIWIQSKTGGT